MDISGEYISFIASIVIQQQMTATSQFEKGVVGGDGKDTHSHDFGSKPFL